MEVKVNSNFKKALRDIGNVPRKYVQKAMVTALNKVGAEVVIYFNFHFFPNRSLP